MTEHTYDWWLRAQAGAEVGGPECPVHDGHPQPGFYRTRAKPLRRDQKFRDQPWLPVAIFVHDGEVIATVGEDTADPVRIWLHTCENHVSEAAYRKALETGVWDDVEPAAAPTPPAPTYLLIPGYNAARAPEADRHGIGGNAPPPTDEIKDQLERAKASLKDYEKITSDDQAARAQSLRSRLLEIGREADNKRVAEKEPHFEAGKAVDALWQPLVKGAKAAADQIASALSVFFTEKNRLAKEEERKALAAQQAREDAARKAAVKGTPAPEAPAPWSAPAPTPTTVKGGYGRAASIKVVKVVTAVTDWDALWGFMKAHPDLRHFMEQLAQRAINAGHTVPGVTVEERQKVA